MSLATQAADGLDKHQGWAGFPCPVGITAPLFVGTIFGSLSQYDLPVVGGIPLIFHKMLLNSENLGSVAVDRPKAALRTDWRALPAGPLTTGGPRDPIDLGDNPPDGPPSEASSVSGGRRRSSVTSLVSNRRINPDLPSKLRRDPWAAELPPHPMWLEGNPKREGRSAAGERESAPANASALGKNFSDAGEALQMTLCLRERSTHGCDLRSCCLVRG
jgi:hypothetical protein